MAWEFLVSAAHRICFHSPIKGLRSFTPQLWRFLSEPAPVPKPKAVKKVADLVEKHDCWLILDKSDQIISTPKVIEEIKATAKCIDGVAYLKELNAQEEA